MNDSLFDLRIAFKKCIIELRLEMEERWRCSIPYNAHVYYVTNKKRMLKDIVLRKMFNNGRLNISQNNIKQRKKDDWNLCFTIREARSRLPKWLVKKLNDKLDWYYVRMTIDNL